MKINIETQINTPSVRDTFTVTKGVLKGSRIGLKRLTIDQVREIAEDYATNLYAAWKEAKNKPDTTTINPFPKPATVVQKDDNLPDATDDDDDDAAYMRPVEILMLRDKDFSYLDPEDEILMAIASDLTLTVKEIYKAVFPHSVLFKLPYERKLAEVLAHVNNLVKKGLVAKAPDFQNSGRYIITRKGDDRAAALIRGTLSVARENK